MTDQNAFLTGVDIETQQKEPEPAPQQQQQQPISQQPQAQQKAQIKKEDKKPETIKKDENINKKQQILQQQQQKDDKKNTQQQSSSTSAKQQLKNPELGHVIDVLNKAEKHKKSSPEIKRESKSTKLPSIMKSKQQFMSQTASAFPLPPNKIDSLKGVMLETEQRLTQYRQKKDQDKNKDHYTKDFKDNFDNIDDKEPNLLSVYQDMIKKDYQKLYSASNYNQVIDQLKHLEKKNFLVKEITRNEELLNQEKKKYNDVQYNIQQKQNKLQTMLQQIEQLEQQLKEPPEVQICQQKQEYADNLQNQLNIEIFLQKSLVHMASERKKLVYHVRKIFAENWKKFENTQKTIGIQNSEFDQQFSRLKSIASTMDFYQTQSGRFNVKLSKHFQDQLEDEASKFEDKKAIKEIFALEGSRKKEQEQQIQLEREQQLQRQHAEREKAFKKIQKEKLDVENQLSFEKKEFEQLQKETRVSNVDELIPHKLYLEEGMQHLEQFEQHFEQKIQQRKDQIEQLKNKLKVIKYENKEGELEQLPETLEKVECQLLQHLDKLQEKENSVKKLEKTIYEVCTVISRIMFQLQGKANKGINVKILRKDILNMISICSLRLEKMMAILAKKKDTIRVESVNTDPTLPAPEFLNLNQRQLKKREDSEEEEEINDNKSISFIYREDDSQELSEIQYMAREIKIKKGMLVEEIINQ